MDPDLKARWVAALRSGKYKQGCGCLRQDDHYCCLGVLWDIEVGEWLDPLPGGACPTPPGTLSLLPDSFVKEHELDYAQGELAALNDYQGYTFPQIAAWIEENL